MQFLKPLHEHLHVLFAFFQLQLKVLKFFHNVLLSLHNAVIYFWPLLLYMVKYLSFDLGHIFLLQIIHSLGYLKIFLNAKLLDDFLQILGFLINLEVKLALL